MKITLVLCFLLSALYGAFAAPVTPYMYTEAASGDIDGENVTTTVATAEPTPTPKSTPQLSADGFNCSAATEGPEFVLTAKYLFQGLKALREYSYRVVYETYPMHIDIEHERNCPIPDIGTQYYGKSYNSIWQHIAVLQGYSELAKQAINSSELSNILEEQMQAVVDIITAVIHDYKTMLANQHCDCNPTATCHEVTLKTPPFLPMGCRPYPYIAEEYLLRSVRKAYNQYSSLLDEQGIEKRGIPQSQWVATRLSSDSPANTYFTQSK